MMCILAAYQSVVFFHVNNCSTLFFKRWINSCTYTLPQSLACGPWLLDAFEQPTPGSEVILSPPYSSQSCHTRTGSNIGFKRIKSHYHGFSVIL